MKKTPTAARRVLLAALLAASAPGCATSSIGDPNSDTSSDPGQRSEPDDPANPTDQDPGACIEEGDDAACEVTSDCPAPQVCLDGICVAPLDPNVHCDEVEGIACPQANQVCVAGVCVVNPNDCISVDDCPLGFWCEDGSCVPDNDPAACIDPGPGPELAGSWNMRSQLHLREGLPGFAAGLLDVSELLAEFINGNVNLGLPAPVEFLIGALIQGIIDQYVPVWAQELVVGLAGVSDVLDDMQVDSTVSLHGMVCDANYRGSSTWDRLTFEYNGNVVSEKPEDIPEIGQVIPEDFGAIYSCGQLFIDRHRVHNVLGGLIRWVVNTVVEIATGYPTVELALQAALPCGQIAAAINNAWLSACGCYTNITPLVAAACTSYRDNLIGQLTTLIDNAAVQLSVLSLKGITDIPDANRMLGGVWYGSVIGGDFPGEFHAERQ